jgi:branched-chain amino acid transport system permease protein
MVHPVSTEPTADLRPEGAELQAEERARALAGEPPAVPEIGRRGNLFADSVKDALVAGLIALVLAAPIVGLETSPVGAGLALLPRWGDVATIVAIVFAGRLLLNLFVWKADRPLTRGIGGVFAAIPPLPWLARTASIALLVAAFAMPVVLSVFAPMQSRYYLDLGTLIMTYVMLGWGLNIVVGLAGLLDLGYVAFYAVGAYSFALLATEAFPWLVSSGILGEGILLWAFWISLPLAGILAALWGIILGFPVLRLRGDYLAIVTLAFGEIIRLVLINWNDFTGGPNGINNIPRPSFFGLEFTREGGFAELFGLTYSPNHRIIYLYYIILILALITNFVTTRVRRLPVGRAWEALREDEIACRSLGINTTNTKLTAFAMGAAFGGIAGSFFATRQGFISPESFNFLESATILAIVVLGGLGSQIGVAIAAIVMIGGIEMLRNLAALKAIFGPEFDPSNYRLLAFGLLMVMIMVWRPRGLVSTRQPTVYLKQRKAVSAENVGEGHG